MNRGLLVCSPLGLEARAVRRGLGDGGEVRRPGLAPGGWAFEFDNDGYPDIDDTAEVLLALRRVARTAGPGARVGGRGSKGSPDSEGSRAAQAEARGVTWLIGNTSR